jgi:hypothetical protein
VRAGLGRPYDPALCVSPDSRATVLASVMDAPADVDITEIALQPHPRQAAGERSRRRRDGGQRRAVTSELPVAPEGSTRNPRFHRMSATATFIDC